jgi:outer membrane protein assembly factor BamE (lipoprotein component of BamABCDE complex)
MRRISIVALLIIAAAGSASAQSSIDPGMSHDQVVSKLGKPSSEHSSGNKTYLYYPNGQEKKMGMSDMVALEDGKVVDAVFRSPSRKYTGKSSSPAPVSEEAAIVKGGGKPTSKPMKMPAPPAKAPAKAAPPTKRLSEPAKKVDAKKIAPPAKKPDTTKKAPPAPAKKP